MVLTQFRVFNELQQPSGSGVLGRPITVTKSIDLPHWKNVITFEFASLDFTAPSKNRYAYMLEGFDKDWIESGARGMATYTGLPGGVYTFRVKGTNNSGVWSREQASVVLRDQASLLGDVAVPPAGPGAADPGDPRGVPLPAAAVGEAAAEGDWRSWLWRRRTERRARRWRASGGTDEERGPGARDRGARAGGGRAAAERIAVSGALRAGAIRPLHRARRALPVYQPGLPGALGPPAHKTMR